jgi:hypothetical protein
MLLTQHPLSAAFPAMSAAEMDRLTDDIATNGQRTPIVALGTEVLDGWHRYQACTAALLEPIVEQYQGDDPAQFVLSLNLHRRHLTESQRAAAVAMCSEWHPPHRTDESKKKGATLHPSSPTNADLAKIAHVSERTIQHAKAAVRAGKGAEVRDGKVSASKAAGMVHKPKPALVPVDTSRIDFGPDEPPDIDFGDDSEEAFDPDAEIRGDYEAVQRLLDADDKLAEAWSEVKTWIAKYEDLERLYTAQRLELATMTGEAKRWMRKAQSLEKKVAS